MTNEFVTISLLKSDLATIRNLVHELTVWQDERDEARLYGWTEVFDQAEERIELIKEELVEHMVVIVSLDEATSNIKQG